jgi:hypothetical protein
MHAVDDFSSSCLSLQPVPTELLMPSTPRYNAWKSVNCDCRKRAELDRRCAENAGRTMALRYHDEKLPLTPISTWDVAMALECDAGLGRFPSSSADVISSRASFSGTFCKRQSAMTPAWPRKWQAPPALWCGVFCQPFRNASCATSQLPFNVPPI